MKGTWGRRVFGRVQRGVKFTRFQLEVALDNGVIATCVKHQSNDTLDQYPNLYTWTLDGMVSDLDKRITERHQKWLRE